MAVPAQPRWHEIDSRMTTFCDALATSFPLDDLSSAWTMTPDVGVQHDLVLVDMRSDDVYFPASSLASSQA